jgi:hypothetical protein
MGEKLGSSPSDIWKLRKTLYGYSGSSRLWWDKVSTWLKGYGFRPLGDNSKLWDRFMLDFKSVFEVVEKDPDYFLGCAIEWDSETGVIQLDTSKYLRKVIAKFDMVGAHPSPIPAPTGMKIYANENWDGDEKFRNLYQQYSGCINCAALIRPELSYYASQICRVMSLTNEETLRITQNILKYAFGSLDEKITFRPADANDPLGDFNYGLMVFSDSDWETSVDTRHSHGYYYATRRMNSSQEESSQIGYVLLSGRRIL